MIRRYTLAFLIVLLLGTAGHVAAQDEPSAQMPAKMALTIPEAIDMAWRNNIRSQTQRDNLALSQARRREARQTYMPRLALSGRWTRVSPQQASFVNDTLVITDDFYDMTLTLSQPIFDGLGFIHTPRARTADIRRQEQTLRGTRQDLAYDTKRVCYDLLKAQRLADVQERAVQRSQEQLETSKARYDLGSASMSDYLKAKVQLGSDSLDLITRLNNIAISRATLNDHLGLPVLRATEIDVDLSFEPYPLPDQTARDAALELHPDVLGASHAVQSAGHEVGSAQAPMWPSLTFFASYNYFTGRFPDALDDVWNADNARFGLQIDWTIFSGFATTSRARQAKVLKHTAEADMVQAKRTVSLAVTTAALRVDEAQKRYNVSEDQVESAQEDLNIAQEKYNLGAATILDILVAQVSLSEAESGRIQAGYDWLLAIADLERSMGGGD